MNKQPWINAGQVILFVLMLLLSGVMTLVLLPVWVLACIADYYMRKLQKAGRTRRNKRIHRPVHTKPEPPSDEMDINSHT